MKKPVLKFKNQEFEVASINWGSGERISHVRFFNELGEQQIAMNRALYQDEDEANLILSLDKRLGWK